MELVELTPLFAETGFNAFKAPCVKGICASRAAPTRSRTQLDELTEQAKRWGAKGLVWMRVEEGGDGRLAGGQVPERRRGEGRRWRAARGRRPATCC